MSNNTTKRAALENDLLGLEIERLRNEADSYEIYAEIATTKADLLQIELDEKKSLDQDEEAVERLGNAQADQLINQAKYQEDLADWEKALLGDDTTDESEECACPDGDCLDGLVDALSRSIFDHPAGKASRSDAPTDPRLVKLDKFLESEDLSVFGSGPKPDTLEGLADAIRQQRVAVLSLRK